MCYVKSSFITYFARVALSRIKLIDIFLCKEPCISCKEPCISWKKGPVWRELFRKSQLVCIIFFGKSEKIHVFHEKSPVVAGLFFVYEESSFTRATLSAIILHEKSHASHEKSPVVVGLFILLQESFSTTATLSGINPVASFLQNSYRMKRAMNLVTRALHLLQKSPISISYKKSSVSHVKSSLSHEMSPISPAKEPHILWQKSPIFCGNSPISHEKSAATTGLFLQELCCLG